MFGLGASRQLGRVRQLDPDCRSPDPLLVLQAEIRRVPVLERSITTAAVAGAGSAASGSFSRNSAVLLSLIDIVVVVVDTAISLCGEPLLIAHLSFSKGWGQGDNLDLGLELCLDRTDHSRALAATVDAVVTVVVVDMDRIGARIKSQDRGRLQRIHGRPGHGLVKTPAFEEKVFGLFTDRGRSMGGGGTRRREKSGGRPWRRQRRH